jgi:ABC-type ATPase with predicted acetyltransferase domain
MYYSDFDSFMTTIGESKSFIVSVDTVDGGGYQSSPYPKQTYEAVSKYIEDTLEARSPIVLWNRTIRMLQSIPAANIKRVTIQFT